MGCLGDREKGIPTHTQKWDFITLDDFRCTSFWTYLAYGWLWFMALVSVAVYTVDTFTAVNLLAYDKWSSQVQPALAFKYSKWLFAACILLSWALALYEWQRALRVIQRGGVAESYMDPLAVTLQSMRSRGWKRFLVFTELTKSKKGTDYIALFVYFAFRGAIRVVLAEGPRQGVNAMTLYAVLQADLLDTKSQHGHSTIQQFFINLGTLADQNSEQAAIYFSMLFTLVIWFFSALSLITAAILYLLFLWHYIPSQDGTLSAYCRRKIDKRLAKIVEHKVVAAMEEEERQTRKAEQKAELKRQKTGEAPAVPLKIIRQPTLPELGKDSDTYDNEKQPSLPVVREGINETISNSSVNSSAPLSRNGSNRAFREPTLPGGRVPVRPGMPTRLNTQSSGYSNTSYASDAPLLANAGFAGERDQVPPMPAPTYNRQNSQRSIGRPMPGRTASQSTQASQRPYPPGPQMDRRFTPGPPNSVPPRFNTPGPRTDMGGPRRPFAPASRDGPLPGPPPGAGRLPPLRSNKDAGFNQDAPMPLARSNTAFELDRDPGIPPAGTYSNEFGHHYSSFPDEQSVTTNDYARHFALPARSNTADPYKAYAPIEGQRSSTGQSSSGAPPQSSYTAYGSQPSFTRKSSTTNFNRPFANANSREDPASDHESFEMTPQPSHAAPPHMPSGAGAYTAFNPALHSASNTPAPAEVHSANGVHSNQPAAQAVGSDHLRVESDFTHRNSAHHSTYGGLLDEYGPISRTPSPADLHHPNTQL